MMDINQQIKEIKAGISWGAKSGSIIEITKADIEPDAVSNVSNYKSKPWAYWGAENDRPQKIVDENMQDGTSAGAIRFKILAHYGAGPYFYRRRVENDREIITPVAMEDLDQEIQNFWFENDIQNFIQAIITDFEWWNMYHVQYIPNEPRNKIIRVKHQRTIDLRAEIRDQKDGEIKYYFLSRYWPDPKSGQFTRIPAFNKMDPFGQPNAIYQHRLISVDKDYYITPQWQSNLKWLAVAKKIPEWINSNIDNSLNIKYHIEIPESYFMNLYPREHYESDEAWKKAVKEAEENLKKQIDDFLAGSKNVGKTFYTKFALDETGNILPGWKITPITNDLKDEAWLNAYGTGAAAIATAHGVPPSLQGLILSNGLGTGSASDVREQFNYYLQLNTVIPRQTSLEWWEFIKRFNKWDPRLHLGYKNIVLQSIDQSKKGYQTQSEQNPTSNNQ